MSSPAGAIDIPFDPVPILGEDAWTAPAADEDSSMSMIEVCWTTSRDLADQLRR